MNTDTTAPDYGEPWYNEIGDYEIYSPNEGDAVAYAESASRRNRIITCVNACVDMADPAAEIAAMRARIAELEAAQEWRPMHDAPRDGTRFVGVTENGFYEVIYWSKRTNDFVGKWSPFVAWMPLPPRPKKLKA